MFNKTKPTSTPPSNPVASAPIPDLPDLARKPAAPVPTAAAPAPAPAPAPARTAASLLAADLTFEGNIIGSGDLQLDGTVRGDVKVGRLIVGETGNVEGSIQADQVEVRGRVVGAVTGKHVKLHGTAFVDGDISHEQLSIDVGAYFQGRCLQARKVDTTIPAAKPTPSAPVGFTAPAYATAAAPTNPAPAADTAQLIELKPASAS
jgi:cytoskeletal protein CcmA (bactofilin family)